jgi:hypothetical protein
LLDFLSLAGEYLKKKFLKIVGSKLCPLSFIACKFLCGLASVSDLLSSAGCVSRLLAVSSYFDAKREVLDVEVIP